MGQGQSAHGPSLSIEQLSNKLTQTFATQCYSPLELYCFKEVFKSLADHQSDVKFWSEATLCRFLELPDALDVGAVIFQLASYLGAFPFPSQAPAILTNDSLLKVITVLSGRWVKVLKSKGGRAKIAWRREIWRGLAVFDRGLSEDGSREGMERRTNMQSGLIGQGFAIDEPMEEGEADEDEEDDDGLVYSAFELMDAADAFQVADQTNIHHAMIPSDNFLRLLQLLLLVAPMTPQESLGVYGVLLDERQLSRLRETANCMLASFGIEKHPGIAYRAFEKVTSTTMPYLLDGIQPLFEHFLFPKDFDLSKRKKSTNSISEEPAAPVRPPPSLEPLLPSEGEILDNSVLNQLSSFLGGNTLFRRLQPLYSSENHGFSMGGFEKACFNWRAPSILLVSGSILPEKPANSRERAFVDSLPYKRFSTSTASSSKTEQSQRITYGAYVPVPWRQSPKQAFGNSSTLLFQLSPMHDVFTASTIDSSYVYFNRPTAAHTGLGFGSPMPTQSAASSSHARRHSTLEKALPLSPVSLHIDDGLEYGVFTHDSQGGGSFLPSQLPIRKHSDWQDRFEIDTLEVWGCGGSDEAEEQRKRWAWEEREAEARRRINFGTGDIDADKELLRMAGLIGADRSGGSMG